MPLDGWALKLVLGITGRKGSTKGVAIELWNVLVRASPDVVFISFLSEEEPGYQNSRH